MKKLLYIFCLLVLPYSSTSFAQMPDSSFAPVGASWWHGQGSEWVYDVLKISDMLYERVAGDTLINGQSCSIIERTVFSKTEDYVHHTANISSSVPEYIYLYSTPDTVFIFNDNFQKFTPLYAFNVHEGDTVCLPVIGDDLRPNPYAGGDTCFCFVIDSIRTVLYDTTYLKTYFEHSLIERGSSEYTFPVYNWSYSFVGNDTAKGAYTRKTGGLAIDLLPSRIVPAIFNKLTEDTTSYLSFSNQYSTLRCYEEPDFSIHLVQTDSGCYFDLSYDTTAAIHEARPLSGQVQLYPNPAQKKLHLSFNVPTVTESHLSVTDALGRVIKILDIEKGVGEVTISLKGIVPGMYYLSLWQREKHYVQKFIITSSSGR